MRVAVLGAGTMGSFHAATLRSLAQVAEVRVYDADPARSAFASAEEALEGTDAALVATPASTHAGYCHLCLDRGLPTFCEKPIALGIAETVAVVDHAEASGGLLQMGFQRRFDAGFRAARERVQSGGLGPVYSFYMATRDRTPPPPAYLPTSGGIFRDMHIHDFDAIRWLFGAEVEEVYAAGSVLVSEVFAAAGDVDTTGVTLKLANGVIGVLTGGRHNPAGYEVRLEIFGGKDSISMANDRPYRDFLDRYPEAYQAEVAHFLSLGRGEAENPCPPREALEALRVAAAADLSLRARRAVNLSEIEGGRR